MKKAILGSIFFGVFLLGVGYNSAHAQLKIAYINSNKILESYKEAVDVRKQLQELDAQWQKEARDMQKEIQELQDQLESQSLLLSDERKKEKQQEIQNLYIKYNQFLQQKWNPQNGEAVKKEVELMQPVYDKINKAIKKIGADGGYNYIFDVVAGNILYASDDQPDLTQQLLDELNKGLPAQSNADGK
ncbi:MAG: OmpH family outer membrane protein [Calditrichaeota bacterium]|nr:MAG: OmpH family outer membrane protein [Calditrichota bacterium]